MARATSRVADQLARPIVARKAQPTTAHQVAADAAATHLPELIAWLISRHTAAVAGALIRLGDYSGPLRQMP